VWSEFKNTVLGIKMLCLAAGHFYCVLAGMATRKAFVKTASHEIQNTIDDGDFDMAQSQWLEIKA
jgi:hypothetical protein